MLIIKYLIYYLTVLFLMLQLNINRSNVAAKRDFLIVATKVACVHSIPDIVQSFGCRIDTRNNRSYGSGHLYLKKPVDELDMQGILHGNRPNRRQLTIVDLRFNGCELLTVSQNVKIIEKMRQTFFKFVNEIPKCPIKANFNYTLTDMFLDEEELPAYVPESNFDVAIYYYKNKKRVLQLNIYGKIVHPKKSKKELANKKKNISQ